jgi:hypothetical protein
MEMTTVIPATSTLRPAVSTASTMAARRSAPGQGGSEAGEDEQGVVDAAAARPDGSPVVSVVASVSGEDRR